MSARSVLGSLAAERNRKRNAARFAAAAGSVKVCVAHAVAAVVPSDCHAAPFHHSTTSASPASSPAVRRASVSVIAV